jgi:predicted nucleotidyltransferase
MAMDAALTPQQLRSYRAGLKSRTLALAERRAQRREHAWLVAKEAAALLRERYGATRVVVFGSLAEGTHFTERSDIDLATAGLRPADHLGALGRLLMLSPDFEFDLVDLAACPGGLRDAILSGGVEL